MGPMNKGSIVERLCSDLIAKNRDINGLLYFTLLYSVYSPSMGRYCSVKEFAGGSTIGLALVVGEGGGMWKISNADGNNK